MEFCAKEPEINRKQRNDIPSPKFNSLREDSSPKNSNKDRNLSKMDIINQTFNQLKSINTTNESLHTLTNELRLEREK